MLESTSSKPLPIGKAQSMKDNSDTFQTYNVQFQFRSHSYIIIPNPKCENNHDINQEDPKYILSKDGKVYCDTCYLINTKRESLMESLKEHSSSSQEDSNSPRTPGSPNRRSVKRTHKIQFSIIFNQMITFLDYMGRKLDAEYKEKESRSFIEYAQDFSRLIKQIIDFIDHYNGKCNNSSISNSNFFCRDCDLKNNLSHYIMEKILLDFHPIELYFLAIRCYIYGTESYYKLNRFENGVVCLKFAFEARRKIRNIMSGPKSEVPDHYVILASRLDAKMDSLMCIGYGRKGKIDKCLSFAQKVISTVLDLKEKNDIDSYILDAIYLAGMMQWKHKKDYDQAIMWLDIGISLFAGSSDTVRYLEMGTGLISVLLDKGDFIRAISFYNDAMKHNEYEINNLIEIHPDTSYVRNFTTCVHRLLAIEKLRDANIGIIPNFPSKSSSNSPSSIREPPNFPDTENDDSNTIKNQLTEESNFLKEIESTEIVFNKLYFEAMEISSSTNQKEMFLTVCNTGKMLLHQYRSSNGQTTLGSETEIVLKMQKIYDKLYEIMIRQKRNGDALCYLESSRCMIMKANILSKVDSFSEEYVNKDDLSIFGSSLSSSQIIRIAKAENATVVIYKPRENIQGDHLDIWIVNPLRSQNINVPKRYSTSTSDLGLLFDTNDPSNKLIKNTKKKQKLRNITPNIKSMSKKELQKFEKDNIILKETSIQRSAITKKILELQTISLQFSAEIDHSDSGSLKAIIHMLSSNSLNDRFVEILKELYDMLIVPIEEFLPQADDIQAESRSIIFLPEGEMQFIPFNILKNPQTAQLLFQQFIIRVHSCFQHILLTANLHDQIIKKKLSQINFNNIGKAFYGKEGRYQLLENSTTMVINSFPVDIDENHFIEENNNNEHSRRSINQNNNEIGNTLSLFIGDHDYIFELHAQIRHIIAQLNAKGYTHSSRLRKKEEVLHFLEFCSPTMIFIGWPGSKREMTHIGDSVDKVTNNFSSTPIFSYKHEQEENSKEELVNFSEFSKIDLSGTIFLVLDQVSAMQTPIDKTDHINLLIKYACEGGVTSILGTHWNILIPQIKKSIYSYFFTEIFENRERKDIALRNTLQRMVSENSMFLKVPWLIGSFYIFGTCKPIPVL